MEKNYYIYIHFRKDNLQPFYVGKGKGKRVFSERYRNRHWYFIVNKYGYFPQIMESNLTEEEAFEREKFYIKVLGRENLCNMTDGGDGPSGRIPWNKGKTNIYSEETKKKLSEAHKGKLGLKGDKNPMHGKINELNPKAKKVINTETGEIYGCGKEVAELFNIKYQTLIQYLNGRRKNKTSFKYLEETE